MSFEEAEKYYVQMATATSEQKSNLIFFGVCPELTGEDFGKLLPLEAIEKALKDAGRGFCGETPEQTIKNIHHYFAESVYEEFHRYIASTSINDKLHIASSIELMGEELQKAGVSEFKGKSIEETVRSMRVVLVDAMYADFKVDKKNTIFVDRFEKQLRQLGEGRDGKSMEATIQSLYRDVAELYIGYARNGEGSQPSIQLSHVEKMLEKAGGGLEPGESPHDTVQRLRFEIARKCYSEFKNDSKKMPFNDINTLLHDAGGKLSDLDPGRTEKGIVRTLRQTAHGDKSVQRRLSEYMGVAPAGQNQPAYKTRKPQR